MFFILIVPKPTIITPQKIKNIDIAEKKLISSFIKIIASNGTNPTAEPLAMGYPVDNSDFT